MFKVTIDTSNAAFDDGMATEIIRLLKGVIRMVEAGGTEGALVDANGSTVGLWNLTGEDE